MLRPPTSHRVEWTTVILHDMSEGPRRFRELGSACPGSRRGPGRAAGSALEAEGILLRRSFPESPPRVEYTLSDKGQALLPIIDAMREFGRNWLFGHTHDS
jgi:DNA-binding HxlR family transcriptional regulator